MDDTPRRLELHVYVSLLLISTAALALEILHMRIFAFTLWHHLAFLVISIAILGFGASGALLSSVWTLEQAKLRDAIGIAGILFSLTTLLGPIFFGANPVDIFGNIGFREATRVLLYYVLFFFPYFFAGYIISITLSKAHEEVGKLYFANMVGSGLGCFLLFLTLVPLGAEGSLFLISGIGALIAVVSSGMLFLRLAGAVALIFMAIGIPMGRGAVRFKPSPSKLISVGLASPLTKILETKWTPLNRVDLMKGAGFSGLYIFQDGDAPAPMPKFDSPLAGGEIHSVAYTILEKKKPKVLIIGVGGGFDVKVALKKGARDITGVEINPEILKIYVSGKYKDITGDPASRKNLRLFVGEGRHFVRRSREKYDLIQMSGVDTYTALASGAYVLSESYLYTKQAFRDYLSHLNPGGILAIIRFAFPAPRETLRIMVMAAEALREMGYEKPWKNIVIIRSTTPDSGSSPFTKVTSFGAVLVKNGEFTKRELEELRGWAKRENHIRDYFPDEPGKFTKKQIEYLSGLIKKDPRYADYRMDENGMNPFHAYAESLREGKEKEFLEKYMGDVTSRMRRLD